MALMGADDELVPSIGTDPAAFIGATADSAFGKPNPLVPQPSESHAIEFGPGSNRAR